MAGPYIHDRVKDTSTTTGTGALTLANSAPTGFRTFGSILANNDTVLYAIAHQSATEWETGIGTYSTTGPTLARTTVRRSSNSNNAVTFSAGTKDVFIAPITDWASDWLHVTNTFANLASLQAGRLGFPSDGFSLYRDTGAALVPWGPMFQFTAPVSGDFAWINQGANATVSTTNGGIVLADNTGASQNCRIRKKAAPATPYTITAAFLMSHAKVTANLFQAGLCFRQSSDGKLVAHYCQIYNPASGGEMTVEIDKMTSPTVFSAAYTNTINCHTPVGPCIWMQISDDGTNRISRMSADGQTWQDWHSVSRVDFLTADEVGFFITPYTGGGSMTLLSWKQT